MSRIRAILETTGGRRFLLAVGANAIAAVLLWYGKLDSQNYALVVLGTVGAYIAGNTYQQVKSPGAKTE